MSRYMGYDVERVAWLLGAMRRARDELDGIRTGDPEGQSAMSNVATATGVLDNQWIPFVRGLLASQPMTSYTPATIANADPLNSWLSALIGRKAWRTTTDPLPWADDPRIPETTRSDRTASDPACRGGSSNDARALGGPCSISSAGGASVFSPSGAYIGRVGRPGTTSPLDAHSISVLRDRVARAFERAFTPYTVVAPPNASAGPDAVQREYQQIDGYSDDEGARSLVALFGPSVLGRLADYFSAPAAVNQSWPTEIDELAAGKGLDWSGPYQVDACASSGSGATVYCVASQRLPSGQAGADAVTFGHFVFYDIDEDAAVVASDGTYSIKPNFLMHEMVHVNQWEQNGDAFVERYALDPQEYEEEAYDVGP